MVIENMQILKKKSDQTFVMLCNSLYGNKQASILIVPIANVAGLASTNFCDRTKTICLIQKGGRTYNNKVFKLE
jgi:hypothetical protein